MSPTLTCPTCGARWHTAARRGRLPATETCLRCGGPLSEVSERPLSRTDEPTSVIDAFRDAWSGDDLERALGFCHPEIEITEVGELLPGHDPHFKGLEGARRWMELLHEVWDVEFRIEPRERRVLDDRSIEVMSDLRASSSGGEPDFEATTRSIWSFEAGKLRRMEFSVASVGAEDAPPA